MKISIDDRLIYEQSRKHGQTIYAPEILSDIGYKVVSELGVLLPNLVYDLVEVIKLTFIARPYGAYVQTPDIQFQIIINLFGGTPASKKVEVSAIWSMGTNEIRLQFSKIPLGGIFKQTNPKVIAQILKEAIENKFGEEGDYLDKKRAEVKRLIDHLNEKFD